MLLSRISLCTNVGAVSTPVPSLSSAVSGTNLTSNFRAEFESSLSSVSGLSLLLVEEEI